MTFEAIASGSTLTEWLDTYSVLVDEAKIHLNEGGLHVRAVDPANVGMVDSTLDADAFESYEGSGGLIGINLERLEDVLGFADSSDLVYLELDEATHKLNVSVNRVSATLALIDPASIRQEPDLPDLDLPAEIVIEDDDFDEFVAAADLMSDHVLLSVDPGAGEFRADAQGDTDDIDVTLTPDDCIDLTLGEARSLFSLDYIKSVNDGLPDDTEVRIELGTEFPVGVFAEFAEGRGSVKYQVAPRIAGDD